MTLEDSIEMIEAQGEAMKHFSAFLRAVEDLGAMRFLSTLIAEFRERLESWGPDGNFACGAIEFGAAASLDSEDREDKELCHAARILGFQTYRLLDHDQLFLTVDEIKWIAKLLERIGDGFKADQTAEQSTRAYLATPSAEEKPAQSTGVVSER